MARVEHKFGLLVACGDCGGHGAKPAFGPKGRTNICRRCEGDGHVPLAVAPHEMTALLAGGYVQTELSGAYTVRTATGAIPYAEPKTTP
jgi:hypothetical protein